MLAQDWAIYNSARCQLRELLTHGKRENALQLVTSLNINLPQFWHACALHKIVIMRRMPVTHGEDGLQILAVLYGNQIQLRESSSNNCIEKSPQIRALLYLDFLQVQKTCVCARRRMTHLLTLFMT
uniref:Uncharacterized protein n=1 Tax=Opuntia streptacantha TaxID=393608 RepID=A0A7C9AHT8_OPUST